MTLATIYLVKGYDGCVTGYDITYDVIYDTDYVIAYVTGYDIHL